MSENPSGRHRSLQQLILIRNPKCYPLPWVHPRVLLLRTKSVQTWCCTSQESVWFYVKNSWGFCSCLIFDNHKNAHRKQVKSVFRLQSIMQKFWNLKNCLHDLDLPFLPLHKGGKGSSNCESTAGWHNLFRFQKGFWQGSMQGATGETKILLGKKGKQASWMNIWLE